MSGRSNGNHASLRAKKPLARTDELVVEEFGDEFLIYDSRHHRAHSLGTTAASIWRACDGTVDVETMSERLDLTEVEIRHALDELEALSLMHTPVDVMQSGETKSSGITRRQMTMRSVKAGAAVVTVPLVYSINVNPALATLTPTPFQCELYTTQDCGSDAGCAAIFGCCCCCQGGGDCKTCGSIALCEGANSPGQPCIPDQGGGTGTNCSSQGGKHPADTAGCCGVDGAKDCGCGWGPGGYCCKPGTLEKCDPGDTDCVPCCNSTDEGNVVITSSMPMGCCKSTVKNCCANPSEPCCQKSGFAGKKRVDCCATPNEPCCASGCAANST
ncbi:MAG TPA: PqqD family protein [Thermoleophilaceae bacterium]|nr:PqqD family protein [Thermoleophilaceae bacterium]